MNEKQGLQIIICSGPEDARRATLGFAAALAACACGMPVTLFLVMDGARWALPSEGNEPGAPGFQPVGQLFDSIVAAGGRVEVCSNCVEGVCSAPPQSEPLSVLRPGVVFGGLASAAIRMGQIPTVTF
ncbi:MAG: DsrE family protein [Acidobacteriia bacterium]|nr:DsrE family protein [Terriglobia bacterium]